MLAVALLFLALKVAIVEAADDSPLAPNGVSVACLQAQAAFAKNVSLFKQPSFEAASASLAGLLSICTGQSVTPVRPTNFLMPDNWRAVFSLFSKDLEALSGLPARYAYKNYYAVLQEVLFQVQNGLGTSDAWIYDANGLVDIAKATETGGGLLDLTELISQDNNLLNWTDIHPFFRSVSSVYKGKVIGIPIVAFQPYLYYRLDLFAKYNLTVPTTWNEYVNLAERMNGTDFDGDGKPDNSLCFHEVKERLLNSFTAIMILASHVQTSGLSHGVLWDPANMQPLVGTPAMRVTLQLLQRMKAVNTRILARDEAVDLQRCLMAVNNADIFKSTWKYPNLQGLIGVAMVPGASQVLDRSTMTLVDCNPMLCHDEGGESTGPAGVSIGINPNVNEAYQRAAWHITTAMCGTQFHTKNVALNPIFASGPIRLSSMDVSPEGLKMWTDKGYNVDDTRSFLTITKATLDHPNRVGDISIKNMDTYREILDQEVTRLFNASSFQPINATTTTNNEALVEDVLNAINQRFRDTMAAEPDPQHVAAGYRAQLKFTFPPPTPSPPVPSAPPATAGGGVSAAGGAPEGQNPLTWVVAPVVAVVVLLVGLAGSVHYTRQARRSHRSLLSGAVLAPMMGPDTTLLLTDIEGSTRLFEAVPEAMDQALALHNALIHSAISKHTGYASASEGDGFIIAFHSAVDALKAATEIQELLIAANWPAELLSQPECQPVFMAAQPTGPLASVWSSQVAGLLRGKKEWKGIHTLAAITGTVAFSPGRTAGLAKTFSGAGLEPARSTARQSSGALSIMQARRELSWVVGAASGPSLPLLASTAEGPARSSNQQLERSTPQGYHRGSVELLARLCKTDISSQELVQRSTQEHNSLAPRSSPEQANMGQGLKSVATMIASHASISTEGRLVANGQPLSVSDATRTSNRHTPGNPGTTQGLRIRELPAPRRGASRDILVESWRDSLELRSATSMIRRSVARSRSVTSFAAHPHEEATAPLGFPWRAFWTGAVTWSTRAASTPTSAFTASELATGSGPQPPDGLDVDFSTGTTRQDWPSYPWLEPGGTLCPDGAQQDEPERFTFQGPASTAGATSFALHADASAIHLAINEDATIRNSAFSRQAQPGSVLVHQGLRVRMGAHSGLSDNSECVYNAATGRHQYTGQFFSMASMICSASNGGMILVSQSTFNRVCSSEALAQVLTVLFAGEHHLQARTADLSAQQHCVYEVIPHSVALRSLVLDPIRSQSVVSPGYQATPCGHVTVAYFQAVNVSSLMAWDADITRDSLALMTDVALALLAPFNGYLLDCSEALGVLAAFCSAADAIKWALVTQQALQHADWHEHLLAHMEDDLGEDPPARSALSYGSASSPSANLHYQLTSLNRTEELSTAAFGNGLQLGSDHPQRALASLGPASAFQGLTSLIGGSYNLDQQRGLKTKCGIDVGHVRATVNTISGRMTCVGKVMNRAARVAGLVKPSQVWCSAEAWDASQPATGVHSAAARLPSSQDAAATSQDAPRGRATDTMLTIDLSTAQLGDLTPTPSVRQVGSSHLPSWQQTQPMSPANPAWPGSLPSSPAAKATTHQAPQGKDRRSVHDALHLAGQLASRGVTAVSLGRHRLKGIAAPAHLVKVDLDLIIMAPA